jgi:hypothetical protein
MPFLPPNGLSPDATPVTVFARLDSIDQDDNGISNDEDDNDNDDFVQTETNETQRELLLRRRQQPTWTNRNNVGEKRSRQIRSVNQHTICMSGWSDEFYTESCITVQLV